MAVLKCKMCGGSLEVLEGDSIAKCEYCGTLQTIPKDKGDKRLNLYDRASHYRRNNDYDKAEEIYAEILNDDTTDAEAYWSLILCKYGIEYVEDPATGRRVPTINRTQTTSIFADEDYKSAIEYADASQREIYEREAHEIDEIQRGILAISAKEEPFDVFICYKETDDNGRRTRDSVLAQELYFGLTEAGFKVFFSRITLEDKLGSEYEPYIFAALRSAKVMVAIGTKKEHFTSPWVRNEWSRFLALSKEDTKKVLIPAYRDMDPYDLPEEFSHLQGQDMAKLGFMQDLIRGIKKIIGARKKTDRVVVQNNIQSGITAESLLARTYLFLEDGEFEKANEYVERILDINPMCAEGYLCNMLVDYRVKNKEGLLMCVSPLDDNKDYEKIMRFGSPELKAEMTAINEKIKAQNKNRVTNAAKQGIYDRAVELAAYDDVLRLEKAISEFRSLGDWKDAMYRAEECAGRKSMLEKDIADNDFDRARELSKSDNPNKILEAINIFEKLGTYRNANEFIADCKDLVNVKRNGIYNKAMELRATNTEDNIKKAKAYFDFLGGYRDAKDKSNECKTELDRIKAENDKSNTQYVDLRQKRKKRIINIIVWVIVGAMVLFGVIMSNVTISNADHYEEIADIKYEKSGDTYIVKDNSGYKTNIGIPESINGKTVVAISDKAFMDSVALVGITIPKTVTSIGKESFKHCTALKNITLPSGITEISQGLFDGCVALKTLTIPMGVEKIGDKAFAGCASITSIDIPAMVKEIGEEAFLSCTSLNKITLPSGISIIENDTFKNCTSLVVVQLPYDIEKIETNAFKNCVSLKKIFMPSSVSSIERDAFKGCKSLEIYAEAEKWQRGWDDNAFEDSAIIYYYSESRISDGKHWHFVNGTPSKW